MTRVERLRTTVDDLMQRVPDPDERRCAFAHLYGVAACCVLLALRRSLDTELGAAAGYLHDVAAYEQYPSPPSADHGLQGAIRAEALLHASGGFRDDEIRQICAAIHHHSDKLGVHGRMAELLKDADTLQGYLCNPWSEVSAPRTERLRRVFRELGIGNPG